MISSALRGGVFYYVYIAHGVHDSNKNSSASDRAWGLSLLRKGLSTFVQASAYQNSQRILYSSQ